MRKVIISYIFFILYAVFLLRPTLGGVRGAGAGKGGRTVVGYDKKAPRNVRACAGGEGGGMSEGEGLISQLSLVMASLVMACLALATQRRFFLPVQGCKGERNSAFTPATSFPQHPCLSFSHQKLSPCCPIAHTEGIKTLRL